MVLVYLNFLSYCSRECDNERSWTVSSSAEMEDRCERAGGLEPKIEMFSKVHAHKQVSQISKYKTNEQREDTLLDLKISKKSKNSHN